MMSRWNIDPIQSASACALGDTLKYLRDGFKRCAKSGNLSHGNAQTVFNFNFLIKQSRVILYISESGYQLIFFINDSYICMNRDKFFVFVGVHGLHSLRCLCLNTILF